MSTNSQTPYVRHLGDGDQRVLAFHCTMAHSGSWQGLAGHLGHLIQLSAPDMLDHGQSPDWDRQGAILERLLETGERLLHGPSDLIGHSFGGAIALALAMRQPDRVRSVILYEPILFAAAKADAPELVEQDRRSMQPVYDALAAADPDGAAQLFNRLWGAKNGTPWAKFPDTQRTAMARAVQILPFAESTIYGDPQNLLAPGRLEALDRPVLLLRGALSPGITQAVNDALAQRLPHARNVVIDGLDHLGPVTQPKLVAQEIMDFWSTSA